MPQPPDQQTPEPPKAAGPEAQVRARLIERLRQVVVDLETTNPSSSLLADLKQQLFDYERRTVREQPPTAPDAPGRADEPARWYVDRYGIRRKYADDRLEIARRLGFL